MTHRIHHRLLLHTLPALLSGDSSPNLSHKAPAAQEELGKGPALAAALARAQQGLSSVSTAQEKEQGENFYLPFEAEKGPVCVWTALPSHLSHII